ncbi:MAG: FN3 domain-containing metallophosphoesterase family protein [Bdellovibrionota bacterium]
MNFSVSKHAKAASAILFTIGLIVGCGNSSTVPYEDYDDAQSQPDTVDGEIIVETSATHQWYPRLILKSNPATTMVIGFNQPVVKGSTDAKVYYDTKDHGVNFASYAFSSAPTVTNSFKGMNNAFLELNNLRPNTAYYFVLAAGTKVSSRYWFKTAPDSRDARLSVIAGGDSRTNRKPRQLANSLVAKLRPHVVMFGGDYTSLGSTSEWKSWFADWQLTVGADGRMIPGIFTRGNHESSNEILEKLFNTPAGVYYGVTFGRDLLRIYTLNTEAAITGAQTDWLRNDLNQSSQVTWKFGQYHRPLRPHVKGKSDMTAAYQSWAPLFHSGRMNLVSESDAHTVKTTWPVRPSTAPGSDQGFIRDDLEGTVFVGEGCWGAPTRKNDDNKTWTRDSDRYNHFNLIFVDSKKVELRTVKVDNAATVGTVSDRDIFQLPAGLDIWSPKNGSLVTLKAR